MREHACLNIFWVKFKIIVTVILCLMFLNLIPSKTYMLMMNSSSFRFIQLMFKKYYKGLFYIFFDFLFY